MAQNRLVNINAHHMAVGMDTLSSLPLRSRPTSVSIVSFTDKGSQWLLFLFAKNGIPYPSSMIFTPRREYEGDII